MWNYDWILPPEDCNLKTFGKSSKEFTFPEMNLLVIYLEFITLLFYLRMKNSNGNQ